MVGIFLPVLKICFGGEIKNSFTIRGCKINKITDFSASWAL